MLVPAHQLVLHARKRRHWPEGDGGYRPVTGRRSPNDKNDDLVFGVQLGRVDDWRMFNFCNLKQRIRGHSSFSYPPR